MIAALWANSNYDGNEKGESPREQAIAEIEENFDEAITKVLTGKKFDTQEEEIDKDNPFFAAAERGVAKIQALGNDEGKVADVVKAEYEVLDQYD